FFFLLKNYGIRTSERIKIEGTVRRGLFCDALLSLFARWNRERESRDQQTATAGDVNKDEASPGDGDTTHSAKTENPPSPASPASQVVDPKVFNPVTPPTEKEGGITGGVTAQVIENENVPSPVTSVTPDFEDSGTIEKAPPDSTAQAGFCIAKCPELFVAI